MFYPQLVAGPIERPQNMLHQFHSYFKYDFENVKAGLMQIAFGLFKKVVVADRLAVVADFAYANPSEHNGLTLLVATIFFSFQIYCDFSGYSDIAIGTGRVMGFTLMENFKNPYQATSINDFWSRWHISLSTWFKDYIYIPLGGNRKGEIRRQFNLFTIFFISGIWHGASWNYVIWGALHGFYRVIGGLKDELLKKNNIVVPDNAIMRGVNILITFTLVMFAWIFFRNDKAPVGQAFDIIHSIFTLNWSDSIQTPFNTVEMWFCVFLILFLLIKEHYYLKIPTTNTTLFYVLLVSIAFLTYFFGVFTSNQFIYFQF
jgi:D-alanyl-lipoteichoic acid acyltransferase DltB (MBOAT superfamily)